MARQDTKAEGRRPQALVESGSTRGWPVSAGFPPSAGRRTRSRSLPGDPELDRLAEVFSKALGRVGFAGLSLLLAEDGPASRRRARRTA